MLKQTLIRTTGVSVLAAATLAMVFSGRGVQARRVVTKQGAPTPVFTTSAPTSTKLSTADNVEEQNTIWGTSNNPFDGPKPTPITRTELARLSFPFKVAIDDRMPQPTEILVQDGVVVLTYPERHEAVLQYSGRWSNVIAKAFYEWDLANVQGEKVTLVELAGGQLAVAHEGTRSEITLGNDTTAILVRRYVKGPPPLDLAKATSAALLAQAPPGTGCCGPKLGTVPGTQVRPDDIDLRPDGRDSGGIPPSKGLDPLPGPIKFTAEPDNSPEKGERRRLASTTTVNKPAP